MEKYRKTWRPTRTRTPKSGYLKVPILSRSPVVLVRTQARAHTHALSPLSLVLSTDVHNRLSTYHALFFSFSTFSWKSLTRYLIFLSQRLFTQHTLPARIESDVQEEESTPLSSKQPLQKLFHPPVPVISKVGIQCDALIRSKT